MKLEKIEFGGIQGRCLSEMVTHIFTEFQELTGKFSSKTYDALDVHNRVSEFTNIMYLYTKPIYMRKFKSIFHLKC